MGNKSAIVESAWLDHGSAVPMKPVAPPVPDHVIPGVSGVARPC